MVGREVLRANARALNARDAAQAVIGDWFERIGPASHATNPAYPDAPENFHQRRSPDQRLPGARRVGLEGDGCLRRWPS